MKYDTRIVNLRTIAIILVILGHSIILYDSSWTLYSSVNTSPLFSLTKSIINYIQMPLFISLSGYLFYQNVSTISRVKFLKNKAKRLLVPFLVFGIFYLLPIREILHYPSFMEHSIIYNLIIFILGGLDCGHLWFLPTLFLIFTIFSFYKDITFVKKEVFTFLLVMFVFLILGRIFPTYFGLAFDYGIYFYLGMLIKKYSLYQLSMNTKVKLGILIVTVILMICDMFFIRNTILSLAITSIIGISSTLSFWCFVPLQTNTVVSKIAANSFGLYLFHSPLVYITYTYIPNVSPWLVLFINFVVFGSISYLFTILLRKTKLRFLLGK